MHFLIPGVADEFCAKNGGLEVPLGWVEFSGDNSLLNGEPHCRVGRGILRGMPRMHAKLVSYPPLKLTCRT